VVIGAGMLGLTACAMASVHGAAHILVVETDPARATLALSFGAGLALSGNDSAGELRERVLALTEGRGAGIALDFSGSPEAMETAWQLLRPGGHLVLAGATFPARPVAIPAEQVVRRMLRITGVYNYTPRDLAAAIGFLAAGGARFPFLSLVGRAFPLSRIEDAFEYAETQRPPRVALLPEKPA
jgi:threonine dehydrogenase-like Zn-dependent dehydrogenase